MFHIHLRPVITSHFSINCFAIFLTSWLFVSIILNAVFGRRFGLIVVRKPYSYSVHYLAHQSLLSLTFRILCTFEYIMIVFSLLIALFKYVNFATFLKGIVPQFYYLVSILSVFICIRVSLLPFCKDLGFFFNVLIFSPSKVTSSPWARCDAFNDELS